MDKSELSDVLGTIAGDDTVLVLARDPAGGEALERRWDELAPWPEAGAVLRGLPVPLAVATNCSNAAASPRFNLSRNRSSGFSRNRSSAVERTPTKAAEATSFNSAWVRRAICSP